MAESICLSGLVQHLNAEELKLVIHFLKKRLAKVNRADLLRLNLRQETLE